MGSAHDFLISFEEWIETNKVRQKDIALALGVDQASVSKLKRSTLTSYHRAILRVLARLGPHDGLALLAAGPDTDRTWEPSLAKRLKRYAPLDDEVYDAHGVGV